MGSVFEGTNLSTGFGESEFTLFRDGVAQIESGGESDDIQGGSGDVYGR